MPTLSHKSKRAICQLWKALLPLIKFHWTWSPFIRNLHINVIYTDQVHKLDVQTKVGNIVLKEKAMHVCFANCFRSILNEGASFLLIMISYPVAKYKPTRLLIVYSSFFPVIWIYGASTFLLHLQGPRTFSSQSVLKYVSEEMVLISIGIYSLPFYWLVLLSSIIN